MRICEFTDSEGFVCRLDLYPAHDCHDRCALDKPDCKPGAGGYHGIGSARWRFSVTKDGMAANFILGGPYLPETAKRLEQEGRPYRGPMLGWDVGFHVDHACRAKDGDWTWGSQMGECDLLDMPCWYDGSGLRADEWVAPFLEGKMDVWERLRDEWEEQRAYLAAEYPEGREWLRQEAAGSPLIVLGDEIVRQAAALVAACRAAQQEQNRQREQNHDDHAESIGGV